jgi:hypothetical protein
VNQPLSNEEKTLEEVIGGKDPGVQLEVDEKTRGILVSIMQTMEIGRFVIDDAHLQSRAQLRVSRDIHRRHTVIELVSASPVP